MILNENQIADALQLDTKHRLRMVRRYIQRGLIPGKKIGRNYYTTQDSLYAAIKIGNIKGGRHA